MTDTPSPETPPSVTGPSDPTGPQRKSRKALDDELRPGPEFVLVETQMGENIGAVARAMLNFGLGALRLVNPRDGWPNERAEAMASGALVVLERARLFSTTAEALRDCQYVLATTARPREMLTPVCEPEEAARILKARIDAGQKVAVLFGGERAGLSNDDILKADAIVSIPVNPAFASLNIAQASLVVAYEWAKVAGRTGWRSDLDGAAPATKDDFERLISHLFEELEARNYFFPPEKRGVKERNLRVALTRAQLTEGEVRTLRGMIKALATRAPAGDSGD